MPPLPECVSCKSTEFTIEGCERICINCGDVQEELTDEGRLCILPDNETTLESRRNKKFDANQRLNGRIRGETNGNEARRQVSRERLLDDMQKVVRQLIKHPIAFDETMDLVRSAFQAYHGRMLSSKKLGIVGACIYFLNAKHQLGITLNDICKVINVKMKVVSVCLKQVRQLCPEFEYERPNIKVLASKFIDQLATKLHDLDSLDASNVPVINLPNGKASREPQVPLVNKRDRSVLENRVMLLIDLFEAMHPYNQPSPQSLITAVVYHAWRSLDTFKMIALNLSSSLMSTTNKEVRIDQDTLNSEQAACRKSIRVKHAISYEKFCHLCDFKYNSNGHKIVSRLQSSLLMLGKHLGNVNKINLPWYLKDIIENSPHLLQEHLRTESSKPGDLALSVSDDQSMITPH